MSIFVQIDIDGPIERLWQLTQMPELHQRWDLRFTDIHYLPRPDADQPQRFLYATRIGFGLKIRGEGESVGSHDGPDGQRTSALKFWSGDGKSLIREGSGYWKYIPLAAAGNGQPVRFLTGYDYRVRFGLLGRWLDCLLFRPLIGWATAWSFDRLRLWIEKGIDPADSLRDSLVHMTARLSLALVWLYQGLVPKLIFRHPVELAMLHAAGMGDSTARAMCLGIGSAEIAIGVALVLAWRSRWPLWLTMALMPAALLAAAIGSPQYLAAPFNPVTLNLAVFALAGIGWLSQRNLPSAKHCVRRPEREDR
jgi:hypothetical protein